MKILKVERMTDAERKLKRKQTRTGNLFVMWSSGWGWDDQVWEFFYAKKICLMLRKKSKNKKNTCAVRLNLILFGWWMNLTQCWHTQHFLEAISQIRDDRILRVLQMINIINQSCSINHLTSKAFYSNKLCTPEAFWFWFSIGIEFKVVGGLLLSIALITRTRPGHCLEVNAPYQRTYHLMHNSFYNFVTYSLLTLMSRGVLS